MWKPCKFSFGDFNVYMIFCRSYIFGVVKPLQIQLDKIKKLKTVCLYLFHEKKWHLEIASFHLPLLQYIAVLYPIYP